MNRLLIVAECSCHRWVVDVFERRGTCRRCGEQPESRGAVDADIVTVCLHEGPCR